MLPRAQDWNQTGCTEDDLLSTRVCFQGQLIFSLRTYNIDGLVIMNLALFL